MHNITAMHVWPTAELNIPTEGLVLASDEPGLRPPDGCLGLIPLKAQRSKNKASALEEWYSVDYKIYM